MQVVYKSVSVRDEILKMPFAYGINMAHGKIQEIGRTLTLNPYETAHGSRVTHEELLTTCLSADSCEILSRILSGQVMAK